MIRTEEKVIGDKRFKVTQLPAKESRQVFMKLVRVLSPIIGAFVGGIEGGAKVNKGSVLDANVPMSAVGNAINQLAYVLSDEDLEFFINKFAPTTEFELPNGNFVYLHKSGADPDRRNDTNDLIAFGGDLFMQFEWLYFALEVNYSSFLKGLGGLSGLAQKFSQAKGSEFQSTSIGTSTASRPVNDIRQAL